MTKTELLVLGKTIRRFREQQGLSQESLADLSHLHRTYIGGIERGERNIGLLNLLRIAKALNILPTDLLQDFDPEFMSSMSLDGGKND